MPEREPVRLYLAPVLYSHSLERSKFMNWKKRFLNLVKDEQGAELAEYAVGVALLVAIAVIVYKVLGNSINDSNSD